MRIITDVVNYVIGLGASAILPITLLILGLIFGLGVGKSIKAGITVGIGFVGINLVIELLTSEVGDAAQLMVQRIGLNLTVIDGGWPSASAAAWGSPISALLIAVCLLVNVILIIFKVTKTMYVDIWNYWYFLFAGSVVYTITNNLLAASIAAILLMVVHLVMGDMLQPYVEDYFEIDNVTLPTGSSLMWVPLGFAVDWILDRIPGINKINVNYETIQKKFGVFGEPMVIGVVIGIILGFLAGYDVGQAWLLGINMGAVMLILPRMIKILLEGLLPISNAAQVFLRDKFKNRELFIGLDSAISLGDSAVISSALILVPIMIILASILPGNRVLPFGDLASIPFYVAFITAHNKGNIFKTVLTGTIMMILTLYMATNFASVYTEMMNAANFNIPQGVSQMSSITSGGSLLNWIVLQITQLLNSIF
ncbi:MAG: PTS galactitol transporter subunit IIC [Tetragenococcus sp.]|nr:PTS galactitol transporter subunit IIC [Tetragenococcus sp.]